jgi:hypothetical protein
MEMVFVRLIRNKDMDLEKGEVISFVMRLFERDFFIIFSYLNEKKEYNLKIGYNNYNKKTFDELKDIWKNIEKENICIFGFIYKKTKLDIIEKMINYDDKNKDELIEYVKENGIYFKYNEDIKIKIIYNKKDDEYLLMYINETIIEVKLQVFKNINDLIVFYKKDNLINKNKDKILYLKNMILTNI